MSKELITLNADSYTNSTKNHLWSLNLISNNTMHGYWEPFYYKCIRKNLEELGYVVTVKKFEDIDKTKPWFISLKILSLRWEGNDLFFSSLPKECLNELIHGKAYLIVNNEDEYWTHSLLSIFYKHYHNDPCIPLNKIIIISGASLIHEVHNRFCIQHNIKDRVKILFSPHMNVLFNEAELQFLIQPDKQDKSKLFTTLNREWRLHRHGFIALLAGLNLLDRGHVSLGASSQRISHVEEHGGWRNYLFNMYNQHKLEYRRPDNCQVFETAVRGLEKIYDKIPICLDKTEFDTNYADWESTPVDYMKDSYFHICSSTWFFKQDEESPGWHEKEWKPIIVKQPFFIVGRPGILKLLRQFGFLTFSKWIDESYDEIDDDWDRLFSIAKEVERLSNLTKEELNSMIIDMQTTLDFNYEVLMNKKWDLFFYGSELKNLINYL